MFDAQTESVKQANEDSLIAINNVNGVGVGLKWVNGVPTNQPAILVFVEEKMTEDGVISKFDASQVVPTEIDGIPTDVIEVGKIEKQSFKGKVRPIKPGYSTGHPAITAGTIGGVFIDKDGDPVVLSNNHVFANENKCKIGDLIYQPGPMDAKQIDFNRSDWSDPLPALPYYATLKAFSNLSTSGINHQDSAIAVIHDKLIKAGLVDPIYPSINQPLRGFGSPQVGMQVQKCGRTTGYTTGRIMALNASFTVNYGIGNIKFNNCVVCSGMSAGGDSGSIISDMNMNAVALLFAGSPKVTIATPIGTIVNEYGLKLWNAPAVMPSMELDDGKWIISTTHGKINHGKDSIAIECPSNGYCLMQRPLGAFSSVSVVVNTGTDKGASWGPGISIQFPNGYLKLNLRHGGSFGGIINGNEVLNIGKTQPNTEYRLRIKKVSNSYIGEILEGNRWYTVIQVPVSVLGPTATNLLVGKTNFQGGLGDHTELGTSGICSFRDLDVV